MMLLVPSMTPIAFVMLRYLFGGIIWLRTSASTSSGISVICHWCHMIVMSMTSHDQWHHVAPYSDHLDLRNAMQYWHWWNHQHLMMPIPVLMALHDQKGNVAPHFNCHDVRDTVVALMMPLVLPHADTKTNHMMWYQHWYQWCHMTRKGLIVPHFILT